MSLALYGHPFSSYTQKVLIALYENGTPFEFRCIGPDTPQHSAEWLQRWPLRKFPLLFYADWTHRISEAFPMLRAYRARLLARPSFARAVEEARQFRPCFPLGTPDRD